MADTAFGIHKMTGASIVITGFSGARNTSRDNFWKLSEKKNNASITPDFWLRIHNIFNRHNSNREKLLILKHFSHFRFFDDINLSELKSKSEIVAMFNDTGKKYAMELLNTRPTD